MRTSECVIEISKAMCNAQKCMKPALKDSENPHFRSKFANLTSVWESIREPLTSNGLSVWQDVTTSEKSVSVITRISHISGEWIEFGPFTLILIKTDAQAIGSATSYAKRYALCGAVGVVADDDDDAEATMSRNEPKKMVVKPDISPKTSTFVAISAHEWDVFKQLLKSCSSEYQDQVWNYLSSCKIMSEVDIDKSLLEKLNKGVSKHLNTPKT